MKQRENILLVSTNDLVILVLRIILNILHINRGIDRTLLALSWTGKHCVRRKSPNAFTFHFILQSFIYLNIITLFYKKLVIQLRGIDETF